MATMRLELAKYLISSINRGICMI